LQDTVSLGCDIHGGRNLCLYFCYDCDVPACSVCLLHEHGPHAPGGTGKAVSHDHTHTLTHTHTPV